MRDLKGILKAGLFGIFIVHSAGCGGEESTQEANNTGEENAVGDESSAGDEDSSSTNTDAEENTIPEGYVLSEEPYWKVVELDEETVWRNVEAVTPEEGAPYYLLTGDSGAVALYDGFETTYRNIGVASSVRAGWASPTGETIVVGEDGLVKQWSLDTEDWNDVQPSGLPPASSMGTLLAVYGNRANNVYLGGENGQFYRWQGTSWVSMQGVAPIQGDETIDSIWVSDLDIVYVVTGDKLYWGKSLEWQDVELPKAMKSIYGFASDNVYAVGGFGGTGFSDAISHFSVAGWVSQSTPAPAAQGLNDVWGSSPENVLAVGFKGTLLKLNETDPTKWDVIDSSNLSKEYYALKTPPQADDDAATISATGLTLRSISGLGANDIVILGTKDGQEADGEAGQVMHFSRHLEPEED